MLIFVVPVFESMFANLGGELPLPTQMLVWMSESLRTTIPIFIVALVAGVVAWRKYSHHSRVRAVVDPLKLKLPVFGMLFRKIALARFARNFSTLLSSGVPILQCLDTVAETTGSIVISRALADVAVSVRQGESLSGPLAQHDVFPPMVVKMMAVGEDTGALAPMLAKVAGVLRPRGRSRYRIVDRADRAADDRIPRCRGRLDDRRALPADLQGLRPHPVTGLGRA